jgi:type IV pilus assembly protein PilA
MSISVRHEKTYPVNGDIVKNTRKQNGFSLIELLIVVAIILIIAAIAIPNLLRARISANESSAASSIRTVSTAEISFASAYPTQGYSAPGAAGLLALGPGAVTGCPAGGPLVTAACLIDWNLSQASTVANAKSGFYFGIGSTSAGAPYLSYTVGGAAAAFNQTGVRGFCSNEDGVIHYNASWNAAPETTFATCSSATWPQLQ